MQPRRTEQLAYSEKMAAMLDEQGRRRKAAKLLAVIEHALGRTDLRGLTAVDVGCSAGFIADELSLAGAVTHGVDIDQPGLMKARARFGDRVTFHLADAERLPFADNSVDVVVLNHIYEHVVDPSAIVREIYRTLSEHGVLYLGLGNRLGIVEPHYKLPFLSWLPRSLADRYVRVSGRGDNYYERFQTRRGLKNLFRDFDVWDYTLPVLADATRFSGEDIVPGMVGHLPRVALKASLSLVPTYIWVAFKQPDTPAGPELRIPPQHL